MSLPRVYRDSIHGQIKFERIDLTEGFPRLPGDHESIQVKDSNRQIGWLIPNLINTTIFQRLRHIRQNGLTNMVFHGAEHSRFSHSMGVTYLAREMYDRISYNVDASMDADRRLSTITAGLLHDIGHGPFSHTIEEILKSVSGSPKFHHEEMTRRLIEENTPVNDFLRVIDDKFPTRVATYIDKTKRKPAEDHWAYRIISSQLDADRLDYLLRDARHAGLQGHGFDLERLLDMLEKMGDKLAVNRGALEAVEAYLIMLEQAYRAIYFHKAVRGATNLLNSVLTRAVSLHREGDPEVFPRVYGDLPVRELIEKGQEMDINQYSRLGEFQVWTLIEQWQHHNEPVLSDLATRLMSRQIFKSIDLEASMPILCMGSGSGTDQFKARIKEAVMKKLSFCDAKSAELYVVFDHPDRVSYKSYDWKPESPEESIWLTGKNKTPCTLETDSDSRIIVGLKEARRFPRLLFPPEVTDDVRKMVQEAEDLMRSKK